MSVLVIAEHENNSFKPEFFKALAAAHELNQKQQAEEIHVFLVGKDCEGLLAQVAAYQPVNKVLVVDAFSHAYESVAEIGKVLAKISPDYSHVFCATTPLSKALLPNVAALLNVDQISNVAGIETEDTFVRPIYAGRLLNRVKSHNDIKLISIVPSAFDELSSEQLAGGEPGEIIRLDASVPSAEKLTDIVNISKSESERPPLQSAKVVVAVGRGLVKSEDDIKKVEAFADSIGAAIGATRAVVDAGWMPNDKQIGQTAKIVSPDLYIALGISGAAQHLAGMKNSKVIIAVNKDENAPIFSVAHYGLIGDLNEVMPKLNEMFA